MDAYFTEYDDSGKTIKKKAVECYFASSDNPPVVVVELGEKGKTHHLMVSISAKQLIALLFGRLIEKAREEK